MCQIVSDIYIYISCNYIHLFKTYSNVIHHTYYTMYTEEICFKYRDIESCLYMYLHMCEL